MKNAVGEIILAIETSGRMGSVAIGRGDELLGERRFSGEMKHSSELFECISGLLAGCGCGAADVGEIYVSVGPGSFTGIRIAVTVAKTWVLAREGVRIVAVDTLDCIAQNAAGFMEAGRVGVIVDAKRGAFFAACYEFREGKLCKLSDDRLLGAEEFLAEFAGDGGGAGAGEIWLLGEGLVYYKDKFAGPGVRILPEEFWYPTAGAIFALGRELAKAGLYADAMGLVPNYLRGADAVVKKF